MDTFIEILKHPFTLGLLLGLLITGFIWKSGFSARRNVARELKRVEDELKNLQSHLNTQLKITASGNDSLQAELESLRKQNETLRVNNAALQQKPGRAEQRLLQIQEIAIRRMREQAPGFAAAWEQALRQGEQDVDAAESGLLKLVRRVIPGMGNSPQTPAALTVTEETTDRPA
jgi:biopolymer transport protein ExbB/TolQ